VVEKLISAGAKLEVVNNEGASVVPVGADGSEVMGSWTSSEEKMSSTKPCVPNMQNHRKKTDYITMSYNIYQYLMII
jgi:hypothetical protein